MKRRTNGLGLLITGFVMVVIASAELSTQENKEPNAASPVEGKFGPTLLRIATRYSISYGDLSMEHSGFVDLKCKIVIEPQWEDATDFREGYAAVQQKGKWGWVDKAGLYIARQLSKPIEFHGGLALFERDGKIGFVDPTGKVVSEAQWELAQDFNEGLAAVKRNGKWGWIDKSGKVVIEPRWQYIFDFHEGLAGVNENGKYGYIDNNGRVVIKPQWDDSSVFSDGLARVCRDKKCGLIGGAVSISPVR
jgi:hypothetical protein